MTKRWISLLLIIALLSTGALAQEQKAPIILMCYYQQVGWGCDAHARFLDEDGVIWEWKGTWETYSDEEESLAFLRERRDVKQIGTLDKDRLFALQSLILSCEAQEMEVLPLALCDYGTIRYTAVRYGKDGSEELIPLALTGDDNRENPEENAHALYLAMTELGLAIDVDNFPPTSFPRQSLAAFCGYSEDVFEGASLCAVVEDCEEGWIEKELQPEEEQRLLDWLSGLEVTGKYGCYSSTSGTLYQLTSSEGEKLASFEFIDEKTIVTEKGLYSVEFVW